MSGNTQSGSAYVYTLTDGGDPCVQGADCDSGFCVDGVCCNTACGGNDTTDCQACTAAQTGALEGVCAPVTAGTTCRGAIGICDESEICDGIATTCPADASAAVGAACGDQGQPCAFNDGCDGADSCVDAGFLPPTTVCRPALDPCDLEETCSGVSSTCPPDAIAPLNEVCRSSGGSCDPAEVCNGVTKSCPLDLLSSTGDAGSPSCAPYLCDGANATCPTTCAVDTDCTAEHYCDSGTCTGELAQGEACTADNQCGTGFCVDGVCCDTSCGGTDTSDCQACAAALTGNAEGSCGPVSQGTVCRDSAGDCDLAEACDGSSPSCPEDTLVEAGITCRSASNDCDAEEECDGTAVACPPDVPVPNGTPCEDGEACSGGDACADGVCIPGVDICGAGGGGAGGDGGGSATAGGGVPNPSDATPPDIDSGCSCRQVGSPPTASESPVGRLATLTLLGVASMRRRKSKMG